MLEGVERLRGGDDFCYPFDGGFCRVNRSFLPILQSTLDTYPLNGMALKGRNDKSVGGVVLANKKSHFRVGGENTAFIGWGSEDVCRARRYNAFGKCTRVMSGPLFHIDHAVGPDSRLSDYAVFTHGEVRRMKAMDNTALQRYIQTWPYYKT